MPHQHVIDDLPAYSLSALDPNERERVELHLRACPSCRLSLNEYDDVVVRLAGSLVAPAEPFGGWEAIAGRIAAGGSRSGHGGLRSAIAAMTRPAVRWTAVAAALATLFIWNVTLQQSDTGPGSEVVRLATANDGAVVPLSGPGTSGRLYLSEDRRQGGLAVSGLPALAGNETYRIWFIRKDQSRVAGGDFQVDAHGQALIKVDLPMPFAGFEGAGITREPATPADTPTTGDVLAGPIYEQ